MLTCPSGHEGAVGEDRGPEEVILSLLGGLECAHVGVGGLFGLAEVEELDAPGHEAGLGQRAGEDGARRPGGLGEERCAEARVLFDGGVHLGWLDGPVEASVSCGDDRVVGGDGGGLSACRCRGR